jgi:hypothetical protein
MLNPDQAIQLITFREAVPFAAPGPRESYITLRYMGRLALGGRGRG